MIIYRRIIGLALLGLLVVANAGCSRSPRVNFYTLAPGAITGSGATANGGYEVAVGPVTLPELVDRPQFVVGVDSNRVHILETERWAEPLKSQLPRLLADNLGRLLSSDRVTAYPQSSGSEAAFQVRVDIRRFESSGSGVTVDAFWTVRRATGDEVKTGRTLATGPVNGAGYDALVSAYSNALLAISSDIASAINKEALSAR